MRHRNLIRELSAPGDSALRLGISCLALGGLAAAMVLFLLAPANAAPARRSSSVIVAPVREQVMPTHTSPLAAARRRAVARRLLARRRAHRAVGAAKSRLGTPYVWGAAGPNAFDCSGLVVWAYRRAGRARLPHSTYVLIRLGRPVHRSRMLPGDLVFTDSAGHMGIYVGGGRMIHAPRSGRTVTIEPLARYPITAIRRL